MKLFFGSWFLFHFLSPVITCPRHTQNVLLVPLSLYLLFSWAKSFCTWQKVSLLFSHWRWKVNLSEVPKPLNTKAAIRPGGRVGCSRLSVLYIIKHHCKNRTNFWLNLLWHSLLAHLLTRYLIDWFSSLSSMLTSSLTWWERVSTRNQLSVYRTACSSCER